MGPFRSRSAVLGSSVSPCAPRRQLRWVCLVGTIALCACEVGCVRRRMTIRSNPPGAMAYVDDYDYPIGTTPISHNFTYYGTRKIRLVKDGYETLTVMEPLRAPWYQIPPLDFVSENLVPAEIHDQRTLAYQLVPQRVVPTEELVGRAEGLRSQAQLSGMVRSSPSVPADVAPYGASTGPLAAPGAHSPGGTRPHDLPPGAWQQTAP